MSEVETEDFTKIMQREAVRKEGQCKQLKPTRENTLGMNLVRK